MNLQLGSVVYLKINPDSKGMITGIFICVSGKVYRVMWSDRTEQNHYEMELTTEKGFES